MTQANLARPGDATAANNGDVAGSMMWRSKRPLGDHAIMANQASEGWRRDKAMTADLVQQANRLHAVARESQNEARRLASAIETLNSDRDRLYTRVTVLEQGLDSVTGTIAKQNAPATAAAQPDPQPEVSAQPEGRTGGWVE